MQDKKIAIVTGAGAGIGKAIAYRLAQDGFIVIVNGRRAENTMEVVKEIRDAGLNCVGMVADVSQKEKVYEMVENIIAQFGKIDVLVNNAGICPIRIFDEITIENFEDTIKTNLFSMFYTVKAVAPYMITNNSGRIINGGSQASFRQNPQTIEYNTSKWAIRGLTRNLAVSLAPYNITVNAYCPGTVLSPMQIQIAEKRSKAAGITAEEYFKKRFDEIPLGRAQSAEEIAVLVSYLASDAANNVTGQSIMINGGQVMC